MSDKPIIFSAPMVRALLNGRKTQTRRVLKPQPFPVGGHFYRPFPKTDPRQWYSVAASGVVANIQTAPYAPGDRLWVRETWNQSGLGWGNPRAGLGRLHYRADPDHGWQDYWGGWRSSIHMPRWASRITITVTEVRVQRAQEINAKDACAEGVDGMQPYPGGPTFFVDGFRDLWNSIHGPDAWDANPWVCALTFTVHRGNIDSAP